MRTETDFLGNEMTFDCMGCDITSGKLTVPGGIIYQGDAAILAADPEAPIPGFLVVNVKRHVRRPDQLMINVDEMVFKVNVVQGQAAEFTDPHPGMEQDVYDLVIFAVAVVVMDKFQDFLHLHFTDCLPRHTVVNDYPSKLESKGVLCKQVIVHRHLKGRPEDAPHALYRAVTLPGILKPDQKKLRVGGFYFPDLFAAEILLRQHVSHKVVIRRCVRPYTSFCFQIPVYQFDHQHAFLARVDHGIKVFPDLFLHLPKGWTGPFPFRHRIRGLQAPAVNELDLPADVILKLVFPISSDGFAVSQHPMF